MIHSGAFSGNNELTKINLSSNRKLTGIEGGSFGGLPNLDWVSLRDNKLSSVSVGLLPWSRVRTLFMGGNPWQCDCSLQFLQFILLDHKENEENDNRDKVTDWEAVECSSAPDYSEEKLVDVVQ